ncbi:NAD(P)H-dependent oxidoreductase [Povalibacter sp.]|uniref:NADPH-dependent FMN reductase n=1 Tax=Povalibacter sp. TaxID=1962978 RepID=UPI002F3F28AF
MSTSFDVAAIIGSLRRGSYTRRLVHALEPLAPPSMRIGIVEIGGLQIYNEDLDRMPPMEWTAFRERIERADAVLFATPEYNRSVPGVLKNAIDVGSRPYGQSVWAGKPAAVISVSQGTVGGFGANHHLRQSLVFLDMPTLRQPEAYIGGVATLVDDTGHIADETRRRFLSDFLTAFESMIRAR